MPDENAAPQPTPQPINPDPTPTGYQRTQGGGFKWVPPTPEKLAKLLPQYEIEALVGRGGMGAVYRGKQKALDRPVAIKILPPEVDEEDGSYTQRFKNEAKIMAKLEHPAIVPVYDFGETPEGQLYFIMSFINGTDVHQLLQQQGRLPPEHALAITAHVCDALKYAHEHGVVHRDIKPSNVLINMEGQVKVADFGLAKVDDPSQSSGLTKTGLAMGTPDYVAPETLTLGMTVDGRADLYAVGVMLYQMLTGNVPRGAFKPASVMIPGIDPRFDLIATKAMQHDREERYQSAAEIRRDLDVILTTPLVQAGGKASAAIPQQSLPQKPVAKGPQKPMGKSANVPVRKEGASAPAPNPQSEIANPKSKTPLFIGLGAVAVIAVGAFVMMGGKKDAKQSGPLSPLIGTSGVSAPTPAQGTERTTSSTPIKVREEPKPASSISSSPSLPASKSSSVPVSKSSDKFPPGKWVKVFTKFEDLPEEQRRPDSGVKIEDGWLINRSENRQVMYLPDGIGNNCAVRGRIKRASGKNAFRSIVLRAGVSGSYGLQFVTDLNCSHLKGDQGRLIAKGVSRLPELGAEYTLEFAVLGARLFGRYNSDLLINASDSEVPIGRAYISGMESIRDIEVINLDGIPEAEALKILGVDEKGNDLRGALAQSSAGLKPAPSTPAPSASKPTQPTSTPATPPTGDGLKPGTALFPPGQWVKVFTKFEELPESSRKKEMKFEGGWLINESNDRDPMHLPDGLGNNCAIRMRIRRGAGKTVYRSIAQRVGEGGMYGLQLDTTFKCAHIFSGSTRTSISNLSVPVPKIGNEYTLEFAVLGNRLFGRYNSELLVNAVNNALPTGKAYISGIEPVRDIEVINLDGIPEAEALRILGVDEKGNDLRALAAKQEQQKAEQAKVVDAMADIPELKTLHEQFVKLQAERVTAPFEADVAKLNTGYLGGLDREIEKEKKAGHLDGVIVLEAEKKLIQGVMASSHQASDDRRLEAVAPCPLPAEDDDTTPANLKGLRQIYRDAFAKLEATRAANLKQLTDPLSVRLKQLESTLTQKNRVPDAKTVREYREALGKEGSADGSEGTPARNATNGGAATTMNEADRSVRAPLKKFPTGDDRKAAEWAISVGGRVQLRSGGQIIGVSDAAKLPRGKFDVLMVFLEFPDGAPKVPFTDLLSIAGLRELKHLQLLSAPIGDEALEIVPSLPSLTNFRAEKINLTDAVFAHFAESKLAGFHLLNCKGVTGEKVGSLAKDKSLGQLTLQTCGITPAGLLEIGKLANLTLLNLSSNSIKDDQLAALKGLRKLNAVMIRRTGLSAAALADMAAVWHEVDELNCDLRPGEMVAGGEILAKAFPKVEIFGFEGLDAAPYSAADLTGLKAFSKLKTVPMWNVAALADDALGGLLAIEKLESVRFERCPAVTDAIIEPLFTHKSLTSLRWGNLQLTDASLKHVTKLRSLKKLDISSCPNLTDDAIAAFKKARPDVTVVR